MTLFHVRSYGEVVSTNELVKRAIEAGEPEGLVCRARIQTGGYGRQGRHWTSPAGGLYQSLLLRPAVEPHIVPTLGFVVALSIRAALERLGGPHAQAINLKWPNDVITGEGKLAGISMESHAGGVCVGIGVNVFHAADEMMPDEKYRPVFFCDVAHASVSVGGVVIGAEVYSGCESAIAAVGDEVLHELESRYQTWLDCGIEPFLPEYRLCNALQGKHVRVALVSGQTVVEGVVVNVDDDGCLVVDDGHSIRSVAVGEAHLI